jgi:hypothetical protein
LKVHVIAAHPEYFFESSAIRLPDYSADVGILSCFGNLFTYYHQIRDGSLYGAVQLIGASSEASKYESKFILRAADGTEKISNTFLVRSSTEEFEAIFNSGRCLRLEEVTAINFRVENKLNMSIQLFRV